MDAAKVGQVWQDNDSRPGHKRLLRVLRIESGYAFVQSPTGQGRVTRIRLDRFRPNSTGYRLVSDPPVRTGAA